MHRFSFILVACVCLLTLAACGDDDDNGQDSTNAPTASPGSGDPELQAQLESILLKDEEVPDGLEAGGLTFSDNAALAGPSREELDRLNQLGRLLGVDLTFVPTQGLGPEVAGRGGIQNSASVYETPFGAEQTFAANSETALSTNWAESYPDFLDVRWRAIDRPLGDESAWIRVTGLEECEVQTPSPGPGAPSAGGPPPTCAIAQQVIIDQVIVRAGRTHIYFQLTSAVAQGSVEDVFVGQIEVWANAVVDRARTTFP